MTEEKKHCVVCGATKKIGAFVKDKASPSGRGKRCKQCTASYQRAIRRNEDTKKFAVARITTPPPCMTFVTMKRKPANKTVRQAILESRWFNDDAEFSTPEMAKNLRRGDSAIYQAIEKMIVLAELEVSRVYVPEGKVKAVTKYRRKRASMLSGMRLADTRWLDEHNIQQWHR